MKKTYVKAEIWAFIFNNDVILNSANSAMNKVDNIGSDPFNF